MELKNQTLESAALGTLCILNKNSTDESNLSTWLNENYPTEIENEQLMDYLLFEGIFVDGKFNDNHWLSRNGFTRNAEYLLGFTEKGDAIVEVVPLITSIGLLLLEQYLNVKFFSQPN